MVSTRHLVCFWCFEGIHMKTLANIAGRFREEEDGAAMIEYAILIGIISVASIAVVAAIGGWVYTQFHSLCGSLTTATADTLDGANCGATPA
jgi:pilus assembly protein Flp/PilA